MKKVIIIIGILLVAFLSTSITTDKRYHYHESPIMVEDWMTQPFDEYEEEELVLEQWMTKPWGTDNV